MPALWQTIAALAGGVLAIILLTGRARVPAFFALLLASLVSALLLGTTIGDTIQLLQKGFGQTMASLAWLVALGTVLGLILQASGATHKMAVSLLTWLGARRSDVAMAATGFLAGLPVFCDAGFVVLHGLPPALAARSGKSPVLLSLCLASSLFVVHCLIPPHPGAAAAALTLQANPGKIMAYGLLVALPALLGSWYWLRLRTRRLPSVEHLPAGDQAVATDETSTAPSISTTASFLPVVLPIVLIGGRSLLLTTSTDWPLWQQQLLSLGEPVAALAIAVVVAFGCWKKRTRADLSSLLENAVQKAGPILLVTGAGGSFGAVLASAGLSEQLSAVGALEQWGLLLPFAMAALLKTAQGSSTVAMLTTSTMLLPLLGLLHLDNPDGRVFAVLAMGAGSMMVSHANDSYFWVVSRFGGIAPANMLRLFTPASFIQGTMAFLTILLLSLL